MPSIGVDCGTSVVKAVLFDDDWRAIAQAVRPAEVLVPRPGWSEQDMTQVWDAVCAVVREVAPADGHVDALCVTAQGDGCWLVDDRGRPVGPALLWNDSRAGALCDDWQRRGLLEEAFAVNGSYGNAGLATAQLAWLREHHAPALDDARTLLSCGSWVFAQLTGVLALHDSDAGNPFLDVRTGAPALDLLDRLDLAWTADLLPEVVDGGTPPAALQPAAAQALGLQPGTPVVLAPYDVPATALGVGAVRPGDGMAVLGTTLMVGRASGSPALERTPSGMTLRTGYPQRWLLAYGTLAGTEVLEWARELLGLAGAAELVALAVSAPRSAALPLVLPYLSPAGERAPFRDASISGSVLGLRLGHGPAEVARAVVEGLSLAVRDCLVASGALPQSLAVCGGGSRSPAWCALLADVCGLPVTTMEQDQAGALGAVLAGGLALGRIASLDEVAGLVHTAATHLPDPVAVEHYTALYDRWTAARTRD